MNFSKFWKKQIKPTILKKYIDVGTLAIKYNFSLLTSFITHVLQLQGTDLKSNDSLLKKISDLIEFDKLFNQLNLSLLEKSDKGFNYSDSLMTLFQKLSKEGLLEKFEQQYPSLIEDLRFIKNGNLGNDSQLEFENFSFPIEDDYKESLFRRTK